MNATSNAQFTALIEGIVPPLEQIRDRVCVSEYSLGSDTRAAGVERNRLDPRDHMHADHVGLAIETPSGMTPMPTPCSACPQSAARCWSTERR